MATFIRVRLFFSANEPDSQDSGDSAAEVDLAGWLCDLSNGAMKQIRWPCRRKNLVAQKTSPSDLAASKRVRPFSTMANRGSDVCVLDVHLRGRHGAARTAKGLAFAGSCTSTCRLRDARCNGCVMGAAWCWVIGQLSCRGVVRPHDVGRRSSSYGTGMTAAPASDSTPCPRLSSSTDWCIARFQDGDILSPRVQ
jgi:hypothetical protein